MDDDLETLDEGVSYGSWIVHEYVTEAVPNEGELALRPREGRPPIDPAEVEWSNAIAEEARRKSAEGGC